MYKFTQNNSSTTFTKPTRHMRNLPNPILLLLFWILSFSFAGAQVAPDSVAASLPQITVNIPAFQLNALDRQLVLQVPDQATGTADITLNGRQTPIVFEKGVAPVVGLDIDREGMLLFLQHEEQQALYHISQNKDNHLRVKRIPLWLSVMPPVIAILLALIFKEVILSLFIGIWTGAFIVGGMRVESLYYFMLSIWRVVEKYMVNALIDSGHMAIIIFSLLISGMVAVISRNGGMAGIVGKLSRIARSAKSSQFATWLLGIAIFFDDYANTLIVGNTMRQVTDKFKVSREKLAYLVDSTAAPVASIAFITTWIGAELGYIGDGIQLIDDPGFTLTPYAIFLSSLKYSFYPVLALLFMAILILTGRDFGPMYKAELRARTLGQVSGTTKEATEEKLEDLSPVPNAPNNWLHAFIPVVVVILFTILGLVETGLSALYAQLLDAGHPIQVMTWGEVWRNIGLLTDAGNPSFLIKLGTIIGASDSYVALLWASLSGIITAIVITIGKRTMKLSQTMDTVVVGIKTMLPAIIILTLAWSLAITTEELHTAAYISAALKDSINPYLLPPIVFILAAFISFSTGSSWSTMAILYPIAIPTTWVVAQSQGIDNMAAQELLFNVIATVLAASVLGDHCSPISDTTILSSLASHCNHIDHVRTQMPYALTVGGISLVACYVSTAIHGQWLLSLTILLACLVVLYGVVMYFGKKTS